MLNWKRFFIGFALLFALVCMLVGSSVYFFDVNDYSDWISDQVKQSTGYDLRFEQLDNSWVTDNRVSLMGVSLYQQQQRIASVGRIDIKIGKLDLWQRQLDINSVTLTGGDVELDMALLEIQSNPRHSNSPHTSKKPVPVTNMQSLAWDKLLINKVSIIDFNVALKNKEQQLLVQNMAFSLNDLSLINNKQLQLLPLTLSVNTQVQSLHFKDDIQSLQLDELQLLVKGGLLQRRAQLNLEVARVEGIAEQQVALELEKLQLALQLEQDKLSLHNLSMDIFHGNFTMQADASLALTLLPEPDIKVKQVTLQALLAKNMQLTIPNLPPSTNSNEIPTEPSLLPIESLLLEKLKLENIDVVSDNFTLPLTLNNLQLTVLELQLIKNNQWVKFFDEYEKSATFSLAFDSLRWAEMAIEQFFMAGSLTEEGEMLQLLQQKFSEND